MGIMPAPKECYLTGLPTKDRPTSFDVVDYSISINDRIYNFRFDVMFEPSDIVKRSKHLFIGSLLNDTFDSNMILTNENLELFLASLDYPRTPVEKVDWILNYISDSIDYEGASMDFDAGLIENEKLFYKLYLRNKDELRFYLETLKEKGFVYYDGIGMGYHNLKLTFDGFNYLFDKEVEEKLENNCFIAMSFSDKVLESREAIKSACVKTGFRPVLIDETHIDSELTINDAILKEIKKSKFCISDFSEQKNGVYFEAGFALGLKKKVIYTCNSDWFNKSHFDTNHFAHIIYDSTNELENMLIDKIEAWIK